MALTQEDSQYERMQLLFGESALERLRAKRVAVFGVGGVGGSCVEALARSGIGTLDLIDSDTVSLSNLNRQLLATHRTIGQPKVLAAAERIHDIDPGITVHPIQKFYLPDNASEFDFTSWDYIVDAIDTVTAKIAIIIRAQELSIPVLSVMGCGNRTDPTKLVVTDLYKTQNDPLARVMRRELKKRGVRKLKVVYSTEPALVPFNRQNGPAEGPRKRDVPGSTAFVPPAAGAAAASVVVKDLLSFDPASRTRQGLAAKQGVNF